MSLDRIIRRIEKMTAIQMIEQIYFKSHTHHYIISVILAQMAN